MLIGDHSTHQICSPASQWIIEADREGIDGDPLVVAGNRIIVPESLTEMMLVLYETPHTLHPVRT